MCDKMIQFNKIPIFSLWNILFLNHLYCKLRGKKQLPMLLCLSDKDIDYIYFAFNRDLQVNFLNHNRIWKSCKNLEGTYD